MKFPYLIALTFLIFIIQSCSTESEDHKGDDPRIVSGYSSRSAKVSVINEMSHWLGSYTFTDSPLRSEVDKKVNK